MAPHPNTDPPPRPLLVLVLTLVTVVCAGFAVVVAVNRRDHGTGGPIAGMVPAGTARPPGLPSGMPTALPSVPVHAGKHFTGDLRTLLVPAPTGSTSWSNPPSTDETLTAQQAAGQYAHPDHVLPDLTANHFTRGAVRTWSDATSTVEIQLLQFDTDAHAASFLTNHQAAHRDSYGAQNCTPLYASTGMVCFDPKPTGSGDIGGVAIFGEHTIVGVVAVVQPPPGDRTEVATLGVDQWVRLR